MYCKGCGGKMKCIYSVPVQNGRYRVYKCPFDNNYVESVELEIGDVGEAGASIAVEGKKRRLGLLRALSRG